MTVDVVAVDLLAVLNALRAASPPKFISDFEARMYSIL